MFQTVYIMLGEECNLNCAYCLQTNILKEKLPNEINDNLIIYLKNLSSMNKLHIIFYGGEPLLYWDKIVYIHNQLKNTPCTYGIASNGLLLNDEIANYIQNHKIGFAVSNDGRNTEKYRGINVLENKYILNLLHKINANVSAVITAKNFDLYDIWSYWYEKGFNIERTNIDIFTDTGFDDEEFSNFDWLKFNNLMKKIENNVYNSIVNNKPSIEIYFLNLIINRIKDFSSGTYRRNKMMSCISMCGTGKYTLNVDLQGNCYLCHNSSQKIGTIYETYENLLNKFIPYKKILERNECVNCSVYPLCNGGCITISEDVKSKYYCKIMNLYFNSFINGMINAEKYLNKSR